MQSLDFSWSELSDIKRRVALDALVLEFLSLRIGSGKTYGPYQSMTLWITFTESTLSEICQIATQQSE